jgi:hypothetical protein
MKSRARSKRQFAQTAYFVCGSFILSRSYIVTTPPNQNHKTVFFRGVIPATKSAGTFASGGAGSEISAGAAGILRVNGMASGGGTTTALQQRVHFACLPASAGGAFNLCPQQSHRNLMNIRVSSNSFVRTSDF